MMPQTLDAKLEQTGTIVSPLLFTRPDSTQGFVHDTYKDFFLAKWFADEINGEKSSVEDLYINHWSYIEDKKTWGLKDSTDVDCRALLPEWKPVLLYLAEELRPEKAASLIEIISHSYFKTKHFFNKWQYNPFMDDFSFAAQCIGLRADLINLKINSVNLVIDELVAFEVHFAYQPRFTFYGSCTLVSLLGDVKCEKARKKLIEMLYAQFWVEHDWREGSEYTDLRIIKALIKNGEVTSIDFLINLMKHGKLYGHYPKGRVLEMNLHKTGFHKTGCLRILKYLYGLNLDGKRKKEIEELAQKFYPDKPFFPEKTPETTKDEESISTADLPAMKSTPDILTITDILTSEILAMCNSYPRLSSKHELSSKIYDICAAYPQSADIMKTIAKAQPEVLINVVNSHILQSDTAAVILGEVYCEAALSAIVDFIVQSEHANRAIAGLRRAIDKFEITEKDKKRLLKPLVNKIRHKTHEINDCSLEAAVILSKFQSPEVNDELIELVRNGNYIAALALGWKGNHDAVQPLVEYLKGKDLRGCGCRADVSLPIQSLCEIRNINAASVLEESLNAGGGIFYQVEMHINFFMEIGNRGKQVLYNYITNNYADENKLWKVTMILDRLLQENDPNAADYLMLLQENLSASVYPNKMADAFSFIKKAHQRRKPQGYNPTVKRLSV